MTVAKISELATAQLEGDHVTAIFRRAGAQHMLRNLSFNGPGMVSSSL
ncbi:MAG: hypothetical protein ACJ75S_02565 [Solirubrobacterales bacterium]